MAESDLLNASRAKQSQIGRKNIESTSWALHTRWTPTRPTSWRSSKLCHVASLGHPTLALASTHFLGDFSYIFEGFPTLAPPPPPLWAASGETLIILRPLDHCHRDHLAASYRSIPSTGTDATLLAANRAILNSRFPLPPPHFVPFFGTSEPPLVRPTTHTPSPPHNRSIEPSPVNHHHRDCHRQLPLPRQCFPLFTAIF